MSAIVVGVYVCALYGAFGTPVKALPPIPQRSVAAGTTRPAVTAPPAKAVTAVVDVSDAR